MCAAHISGVGVGAELFNEEPQGTLASGKTAIPELGETKSKVRVWVVGGGLDDPRARTKFTVEQNTGTDGKVSRGTGFQVKTVNSCLHRRDALT